MLLASGAFAEDARFAVYEIYLDPAGEPLAAYQLKISDENKVARIISIEGGDHPAFKQPPLFDPAAIQRNIVKLAAFSTEAAGKLPQARTRVASLHVELDSGVPKFKVQIEAIAAPGGRKIAAIASVSRKDD